MATCTIIAQTIGIATAFTAAGGIASLTVFDMPMLQSQPASRSLPQIRWLFSRGSHIYPTAALISSGAFAYAAYASLPSTATTTSQALKAVIAGSRSSGFLAAALLTIAIGPFTQVMIPTNFKLIDLNAEKGGYRTAESAKAAARQGGKDEADGLRGEGNTGEFTDLSGPQSKTKQDSSPAEDREVQALLSKFAALNAVRAALMLSGGLVGVITALM